MTIHDPKLKAHVEWVCALALPRVAASEEA